MSQLQAYAPHAPAPARPRPDQHRPSAAHLSLIIRRIEEAIDEETAAIRSDPRFDIAASNTRKSRHLYELNRATRGIEPSDFHADHEEALKRLREKLVINERAILAHLNAVKEVADILQNAIQRAETDGTYSAREFGRL